MKKVIIFLLGLYFCQSLYSRTTVNFTKELVVIYKILNPLTVTVDKPEKMVVKAGNQIFRYSETVSSKVPLNIRIEAPYNVRDGILDQIYGTATLELENNGKFDLTDGSTNNVIKGRGFFLDNVSHLLNLKLESTESLRKYHGLVTVDAVFNEDGSEMLMGNYKGVLRLNVTYGK